MYLKEYFPFYTTYANPLLYEGERMQDKEFNLMKSYYPGTVQHIQEKIEEECDLMDYEGSRLYDEYPDKYMIYHLGCKIRESMELEISTQAIREDFLDELIQVMLCQEISRRRCLQISLQEILLKQIVIVREIGLLVHRTVTTDYITLTDRKSNEKFKRIFRRTDK